MNIGEKIKNLRMAKIMTQKELAGDEITRNMLSQIESGAALPSLKTLIYLAGRLSVPVGYLVSDGSETESFYKKYSNYPNIIESYKSGEWEICRDLCLQCLSDGNDNELIYMLAQSSVQLGILNFNEGKLKAAANFFEDSLEFSKKTVFDVGSIRANLAAYSTLMSMISPTLTLDIDAESEGDLLASGDLCKFVSALTSDFEYYLSKGENAWKNCDYYYVLNAKALMNSGNYSAALSIFSQICDNDTLPTPIIYIVLEHYETCCKETENFKDAYEISQAKIQLFEKLLAE